MEDPPEPSFLGSPVCATKLRATLKIRQLLKYLILHPFLTFFFYLLVCTATRHSRCAVLPGARLLAVRW